MRDRDRLAVLSLVTLPLAWYAVVGGPSPVARGAGRAPAAARVVLQTDGDSTGAASPPLARQPPSAAPSPTSTAALTAVAAGDASRAARTPVVPAGDGHLTVVPGGSARSGPGPLTRYRVLVEGGLGIDGAAFAATVDSTLADPRSWGHGGARSFERVSSGPYDVRVVLASPATVDRMCAPLSTRGQTSCAVGTTAVVNALRWLRGAAPYTAPLLSYRQYVVDHEVGHALGHGHVHCPAPGRPAPVMVQQTLGLEGCCPNPWPYP